MLINNQNYLHGRLVGIGKVRKDGTRDFRFLDKPIHNTIMRCGLNEFMTYNGSNSAYLNARQGRTAWYVIDYCGFGTSNAPNDFATTEGLQSSAITPYVNREYNRGWPFSGLYIESGTATSYKIRVTHKSPAVSSSVAVREIGYFKNYGDDNTPVCSDKLFSRIVLPFVFQLDPGDSLMTTYEVVVGIARNVVNIQSCGLHDSSDVELGCQVAQCVSTGNTNNIYGMYPSLSFNTLSSRWASSTGGQSRGYQFAPYNFYDRNSGISGDQASWDLRYTKSSFDFPTGQITSMSYRGVNNDRVTCQNTNYTSDSFYRDVIVNVPAYWPEMTLATDYRDLYAINWGTLFIRFGHFDANMNFTPAPWRKLASRTAKFVFRQSIATQDSIAWQQSQQP